MTLRLWINMYSQRDWVLISNTPKSPKLHALSAWNMVDGQSTWKISVCCHWARFDFSAICSGEMPGIAGILNIWIIKWPLSLCWKKLHQQNILYEALALQQLQTFHKCNCPKNVASLLFIIQGIRVGYLSRKTPRSPLALWCIKSCPAICTGEFKWSPRTSKQCSVYPCESQGNTNDRDKVKTGSQNRIQSQTQILEFPALTSL